MTIILPPRSRLYVGTAGWSVPALAASRFPAEGSHLERYAACFPGVEINTTFYRPHQTRTFERWAASVPPDFRFAVKAPRQITHDQRLVDATAPLAAFLDQTAALGDKRGPLLFQLPPSLTFQASTVSAFLDDLRRRFSGLVAWEPRHKTWFSPEAERILIDARIARVAADPPRAPEDGQPGGWPGLAYWRLHGSPHIYYSPYGEDRLGAWREAMKRSQAETRWCIFDNTAAGAATVDALALLSAA